VKVLLDENLDHALRRLLGDHEVFTAAYMGWAGLQNGALLRAAEGAEIDVLLTGDQTLHSEQNLKGRRLAVVALSEIRLPVLRESLSKIIAAIDSCTPGSYQEVDCGTFSRKRTFED
jgi:hypothetical protein